MAETLTFTTPPVPTAVQVVGIEMYLNLPGQSDGVRLHLLTDIGEIRREWIGDDEGRALIVALNTMNLSTISLRERVLRWLASNRPGYEGTVTP